MQADKTQLKTNFIFCNLQLGLRTTASGHSALSVNKSAMKPQQHQPQQQNHQQQQSIAAVSVSSSVDLQNAIIAAGPSYTTMRDRPLPATPRIYEPIQEQQIFPSNGSEMSGINDETELLFNKSIEPHPIIVSANAINNNTISNNSISNSNLSNLQNNNSSNDNSSTNLLEKQVSKVPPRPPPKPKKKMQTISAITENPELGSDATTKLFQDECEDGTEV